MKISVLTAVAWAALTLASAVVAAGEREADLLKALGSGDEPARLHAIDTLGQQGREVEGAVAALVEQLGDKSAMVRAHAAHALGQIGPAAKPAAKALAKLTFEKDPHVRREAIEAYSKIRPGPEVSIPLFTRLFAEADEDTRIHVMHAMAEEGKAAVPPLTKALANPQAAPWACLVLAEIGPDAEPAVSALTKLIQSDARPEVRQEAILTLAAIGPKAAAAVPVLKEALGDQEGLLQGPAVFALGAIGVKAKDAEGAVKKLAEDPQSPPFLQTVSLWALARMNPDDEQLVREVVPRLVDGLQSSQPRLRAAAARALVDLDPDPEIVRPLLKKAMEDADPAVLDEILNALAGLGEAAVPRLIGALEEEEVRAKAAAIIARIGPPAKAAVPALIEALGDKDPLTRNEVLFALAAIGPDAAQAVPAVVKTLDDPDVNIRYAACYALGKIGPAAMPAKAALQRNLGSEDAFMSLACAWTLAQVHPECAETAPKSVPVLAKALTDPDPMTRRHAAEALGCLGPLAKQAMPALRKALEDGDQQVRDAAAEALKAVEVQ